MPHNYRAFSSFRREIRRIWLDCLRRRSQKGRRTGWEMFDAVTARFALPLPRITHPWAARALHGAGRPWEEPGAGKPQARISEGESRIAELLDRYLLRRDHHCGNIATRHAAGPRALVLGMGVGLMRKYEGYGLRAGKLVNPNYIPHFLELAEDFPDEQSALLDQKSVKLKNLSADQQLWRDQGYLIKRNFIPHSLIDEYLEIRRKLKLGSGVFPDAHPFLYASAIRDMCCSRELHYLLVDLIGEEMGLHFTLNEFKSSERGWHQDDYFNPENIMARYLAIWMAMGDIHPDSGPFEFVSGSHKWPCLRGAKVRMLVVPELREESGGGD